MSGKHTIVTTSTASGKSLIYILPVLNSYLSDNHSTALYLTPLAADNLRHYVVAYLLVVTGISVAFLAESYLAGTTHITSIAAEVQAAGV